jgi:hypothetical protein
MTSCLRTPEVLEGPELDQDVPLSTGQTGELADHSTGTVGGTVACTPQFLNESSKVGAALGDPQAWSNLSPDQI